MMNFEPKNERWPEQLGIPRRIWQTYISKDLTGKGAICVESWKRMNTSWKLSLCDDPEIDAMMAANYSSAHVEAFRGFPLGVMRADMWRYAVVQRFGGLYADADCSCSLPISHWDISPPSSLSLPSLLICLENHTHFCNWAFAASPGHPVLKRVLELIVERYAQGIDTSHEHFVHEHTGPGVWTRAICDVIGTDLTPGEIFEDQDILFAARKKGILILEQDAFSHKYCRNEYGSHKFGIEWVSWTAKRNVLLEASRGED